MTKKELRQLLRDTVGKLSPTEQHQRSLRACARLMSTREYEKAEVIMVFLSLPNEIDTTPLVLRAWRDSKRVLAPKVSWEQRRMLPLEIHSLSDDVAQTTLGLREPVSGMPFPVGLIDLAVVPGLGYDLSGNRVGRGQGFYDRFLAHRDWRGTSCGLAFQAQVVDSVPITEEDMQVDMLVTETQVLRFGP